MFNHHTKGASIMAVLTAVIAGIATGAELVKNIKEMTSIIPKAAQDLSEKHRWMTITVFNQTQFLLLYKGNQLDHGRFWTPPGNVKRFDSGTFSVCNKDGSIGTGASGGVKFQLQMPMDDGGYQELDIAVGFARPEIGSRKCAAIYSSNPEQAYNAATSEGTIHTSRQFTGTNMRGEEVTIEFGTAATPGEGSTVTITERIVAK
jgi:hypothetical protein